MKLGLVGLGRMGSNMRERLRDRGHDAVGYDPNPEVSDVASLEALVEVLPAPRAVWVMVPAGQPTREVIGQLSHLLSPGDLVVDGGNSRFTDDHVHAALLAEHGIHYVDCGVSGGVWGRQNGYALMAGGDETDITRLLPVFDALRPDGERADSFVHAGGSVPGTTRRWCTTASSTDLCRRTQKLRTARAEESIQDVPAVLRAWSQGTVVRSWLLDLLVQALSEDPALSSISGYTEDSGEGRWTVEEAIAHAVPAPVISAALFARFASRQDDSPAMKAVSALRQQFGGHAIRRAAPAGIA
ncbi:NADP(+)-dependent, decarboxylating phosphogluconate dehydrogenase [Rhodococcus koreensis]|uniref:6-phosphogluconate dehydrogenase n=1 Tax=Rhodococcus koreensis TaxID=99653 RepID=A0A1H5EZG3_9NOCA|nr:decarboxylating 6-phosphogluconate dehydrogenase [Rhodococcus koreensis]SED96433.1 6-phosphogluconate dehydrogenase [Rhodococcus koreensis]